MKFTSEKLLSASPEDVWRAVNDPDVLTYCISGCQHVERLSETEFSTRIGARVGPIKIRLAGLITITDIDPAHHYTLIYEGEGPIGFCHGEAHVKLIAENAHTRVFYDVEARVGGKLTRLGAPLIDAAADRLAARFFTRLDERLVSRSSTAKSAGSPP